MTVQVYWYQYKNWQETQSWSGSPAINLPNSGPGYSAMAIPEPPISFGRSFIFGSPSRIRSRDSW